MTAKEKLIEVCKNPSKYPLKGEITDGRLLNYLNDHCIEKETISESRWWSNTENIAKIDDTYFAYGWATANRDESIWEIGWDFDWDSLTVVEPYEETITIIKYKEVIED